MAENDANTEEQLNQAQKDAIEQLKKMQAERGWNDEALKEHISKINELTSQEAIQEYLEKQKNKASSQADENTQEGEATQAGETTQETTDRSSETTEGNTASEDKPQTSTTVHEVDPNKTSGNENTDTEHKDEPEWKKLRRQEWEKYATQERQEFKLLSEDKAPDLNMSVGGTSINYANEHEVTMANTDEYSKFVKLIEIEKKAHTDVINFGEIQSEDYRSKLAAACLQVGLEMSNGPKHIDLSLDCFKNLDDATKQKIEAYNRKQAEREQSNQSEQGNESKPEPTAADTKNKTKEEYQKLYEAKLAELKAKKEKGESVDFSSIKDPVDRILTYAAAKENKLKIENLNNNELLYKENTDRQGDIETTLDALPKGTREQVELHEKRVNKLHEVKQLLEDKKLRRGQYRDKDGNIQTARLTTHTKDGTKENVERNQVKYEIDENGRKHYKHDENTNSFILRKQNGGR